MFLVPLSWLYGLVVRFRNHLFDAGVLKRRTFSIPVIGVGNITVGGTGKTPHVEYLVRLLSPYMKVAVLSRGYKRKSKGYLLADATTSMRDIGDEPYQIHKKFPDIHVAVDANRCEGIERLTGDERSKDTSVILLDDAFQHRYVKPGINILLVDYNRPISTDRLLPAGRLREPVEGKERADIVIVTKCPRNLKPMEFRVMSKMLSLRPYQKLYYTTLEYEPLYPLYGGDKIALDALAPETNVLLLTGIASPQQMELALQPRCASITPLTFGDHHQFKPCDIEKLNSLFASLPEPRMVVTTEKDSARLVDVNGLSDEVRNNTYVLPVRVDFLQNGAEAFNKQILSYIKKNSKSSILLKGKEDVKPKEKKSSEKRNTIRFK